MYNPAKIFKLFYVASLALGSAATPVTTCPDPTATAPGGLGSAVTTFPNPTATALGGLGSAVTPVTTSPDPTATTPGGLGSAVTPVTTSPDPTATTPGALSSGDFFATIASNVIKELQLALFLENLELSFFNTSLANVRQWDANVYPNGTIQAVEQIITQEEFQLGILTNVFDDNNVAPVPRCTYSFSMNSTEEFLELAHLITSIDQGATIGIIERLTLLDSVLVGSMSSILAVKPRHDAFFRCAKGKVPHPTPFNTGISGIWAYNLALAYIIPGSCPVELPLPILPRLAVAQAVVRPCINSTAPYANFTAPYANFTAPHARNTTQNSRQLEFSWDPTQEPFVAESGKQLLIGWVDRLHGPIYTPLSMTATGKGTAHVPQGMNGIIFAAVTVQRPSNIDDLGLATLAGPVAVSLCE